MAQVLGVGGVFFKAEDPAKLAAWYGKWLGLDIEASFGGSVFRPATMPAGGYTIWGPFPADTGYFEPSPQRYMINLIVDDLEAALEQVAEGGGELVGEPESSEFGDFGWFLDPEGNKIELWKPAATPPG